MPDIPVDRKNDDPAVVFAWIQSLMCDPKDVNGVRSWIALLSSPELQTSSTLLFKAV